MGYMVFLEETQSMMVVYVWEMNRERVKMWGERGKGEVLLMELVDQRPWGGWKDVGRGLL